MGGRKGREREREEGRKGEREGRLAGAVPPAGLWDATKINKESRPAKGEGDGEVSRRARQALDESGNSLPQLSAVFNANFATDWQSQPGSATLPPPKKNQPL